MENVDGNIAEMKDTVKNTEQNVTQISGELTLFISFFETVLY